MKTSHDYDVIIVGAGAAGLMCAIEAGKRGRSVCLMDHAENIAEKIRISGGGSCNFTNLNVSAKDFISSNPHFCKSALAQFSQNDFISLLKKHNIPFHEKKLGQLFCDEGAGRIINMLLTECETANVTIKTGTTIDRINAIENGYQINIHHAAKTCSSLVIATGGLSIPKIGATKFGYDIARQFGINIIKTHPALVPFTFQAKLLEYCSNLSGLSVEAEITCNKTTFSEGLLFTHRGLSGPAILQISSYWKEGDEIIINLAPKIDMISFLMDQKEKNPKQTVESLLTAHLPKRLASSICESHNIAGNIHITELSKQKLQILAKAVNEWRIKPAGTEGYRKAEVTCGGIDTNDLSSKTMETKKQPGLYFIGELVDVTGHLGGFTCNGHGHPVMSQA